MPDDERRDLLLQTLAQVAISVELEPTIEILLSSLRELIPFDAGGMFVRDAERLRAATRGCPHEAAMSAADHIVDVFAVTRKPRLVRDVAAEPPSRVISRSTASQLSVALSSPRGILGAISLESDRPSAFDERDLQLLTLFAPQATVVIERSLLHEQLMRQSQLGRELEVARDILQSLTPASAPTLDGMQVAGRSLTADAEAVGGDAYDFIVYPDGQLGVSIADAKGKGIPAALLAVANRAMLHALVGVELRLRATFTRMSDILSQSVPAGNFITTFYGIMDPVSRRMVYVNAGHLPPLLVRQSGSVEQLDVTGPALGLPRVSPMREGYAAFARGDGLVLFTDGVTEVGPTPDEFFDIVGVETTVRKLWTHDADDICDGLLDEVSRRANGASPDDATVVVVKFL